MNTVDYTQKFFQKKDQLTFANKTYQELVHDLFIWLLKNDQVKKDLTTNSLFDENKTITSCIITRQPTTIAGLEEIEYFIQTFTQLEPKFSCKDGDSLRANQEVMTIKGDVKELLSFERVLLNILQRFSGIATETSKIISDIKNEKPYIAATRKTIWGVLDKKAVAVGGGLTHRLDLSDGILVKDNHLMLMSATEVLEKLLSTVENTLIEIEVEDETNFNHLIQTFTKSNTNNVLGILLDNFSPVEAKRIIAQTKKHSNILYEASGGITSENISAWADTGVDIISLGSLTHSPKAANLSLEININ